MLLIVLLVMFTLVMFLWLLSLLGAAGPNLASSASPWLAFFACLILGIMVFLIRTGALEMPAR